MRSLTLTLALLVAAAPVAAAAAQTPLNCNPTPPTRLGGGIGHQPPGTPVETFEARVYNYSGSPIPAGSQIVLSGDGGVAFTSPQGGITSPLTIKLTSPLAQGQFVAATGWTVLIEFPGCSAYAIVPATSEPQVTMRAAPGIKASGGPALKRR